METMNYFAKELEESYQYMGNGEYDTDTLLAWEKVKGYLESGENLTLTVDGVVNKGVITMVEGLRGFIPVSRLSLSRVEDLNSWLGKTITVRVIQADMESKKLVLSAREILQEAAREARKLKVNDVKVGDVKQGTVQTLKDYGAFVDLGDGVSGLLHISQITNQKIKHPKVVLSEGQEVTVKVIKNEGGKISLSMKALEEPEEKEEEIKVEIPKAEEIGTSLGSLLANLKLN